MIKEADVGMNGNGAMSRFLAPTFLALCILLGGSSSGGLIANSVLQIASVAVILFLLHRGVVSTMEPAPRRLLVIVGLAALFLTVTLIPLPLALWRLGAGREAVAAGYAMVGMVPPSLSMSLSPNGTIAALLAFLPPVAMFLCLIAASPRGRLDTVMLLVALTVASILFGVFQQLSGYRSTYYFYDLTSRGGAVGFFANRNHLATLCLMVMPFVAALAVPVGRGNAQATLLGRKVLAAGVLLFLTLGALVVQSLAGWLLLAPTLLGCLLIYQRRGGRSSRGLMQAAGVTLVIAVLAALFAPISPSDVRTTVGEIRPHERRESMRLTEQAAMRYFPVGSGFGSFTQVYPRQEDPAQASGTFVNHAHNDYLELFLEGGLAGVAFLILFLAWAVRQGAEVWRRGGTGNAMARAGSVALLVVLAHGFVDYPVRTAAIASIAALACAMMTVAGEVEVAARARLGGGGEGDRTIALGGAAPTRSKRRSPALVKGASHAIPG